MHKYLDGIYLDNSVYEDINTRRENDLILGLRLIDGISIDNFNDKYNDNLLNIDIIKELINDGYLEVINNHLRCKEEYLYIENSFLEKIIDNIN